MCTVTSTDIILLRHISAYRTSSDTDTDRATVQPRRSASCFAQNMWVSKAECPTQGRYITQNSHGEDHWRRRQTRPQSLDQFFAFKVKCCMPNAIHVFKPQEANFLTCNRVLRLQCTIISAAAPPQNTLGNYRRFQIHNWLVTDPRYFHQRSTRPVSRHDFDLPPPYVSHLSVVSKFCRSTFWNDPTHLVQLR